MKGQLETCAEKTIRPIRRRRNARRRDNTVGLRLFDDNRVRKRQVRNQNK